MTRGTPRLDLFSFILAPCWHIKLHKNRFHTYQASPRGSEIFCEIQGERVLLTGKAALYLAGEIYL